MQIIMFTGFEKQLGSLGKKYRFDTEKFLGELCRDIIRNPGEDAVLIAESDEHYQCLLDA